MVFRHEGACRRRCRKRARTLGGNDAAKVHDAKVMDRLIREDDAAVYGDKGYASDEKKRAAEGAGVLWAVKEKAKPGRDLTKRQRARNRRFGKVRAKVEHIFRIVKCQFGYRKVRYRGIAKNGAQVFTLFALANLTSSAADLRPQREAEGSDAPDRAAKRPIPSKKLFRSSLTTRADPAIQRFPRHYVVVLKALLGTAVAATASIALPNKQANIVADTRVISLRTIAQRRMRAVRILPLRASRLPALA